MRRHGSITRRELAGYAAMAGIAAAPQGCAPTRPGPAALVRNAEQVRNGMAEEEVKRILGEPDRAREKSWLYYVSRSSWYNVEFDSNRRVQAVHYELN